MKINLANYRPTQSRPASGKDVDWRLKEDLNRPTQMFLFADYIGNAFG